ncbi:helix-turn-helix domain-containing protein [Bacillus thuringiensis]|uniref:helix-turn-helix domain-containing protein n=1 Tax=Bacillus thuringiensis TaxID=1428 RepID=UPI001065ABB0|nr:helix-turn-helix domain-containing protein [Bacillus thuringiensis]TEA83193.1 hypothetical protein PBMB05447_09520 [Bacillus thuringiensis F14-1]
MKISISLENAHETTARRLRYVLFQHYFAGLNITQILEAVGISKSTFYATLKGETRQLTAEEVTDKVMTYFPNAKYEDFIIVEDIINTAVFLARGEHDHE